MNRSRSLVISFHLFPQTREPDQGFSPKNRTASQYKKSNAIKEAAPVPLLAER